MSDFMISQYECKNCGLSGDRQKVVRENDVGYEECSHCGYENPSFTGYRRAVWCSVAVYDCDRAYGGPEEGGWWYGVGNRVDETIRCFEEGDYPQVKLYVEMLQLRWDEPRYRVKYAYEELVEKDFPKKCPHYC